MEHEEKRSIRSVLIRPSIVVGVVGIYAVTTYSGMLYGRPHDDDYHREHHAVLEMGKISTVITSTDSISRQPALQFEPNAGEFYRGYSFALSPTFSSTARST
jgi:hypothetical protein